ncbi:MAG: Rap1a/Tai family immunity protein [Alphaproteobacteria bacterium]|nr:Rap1a/Tai family immunity protein [Alphaproteobacteria bacterium]
MSAYGKTLLAVLAAGGFALSAGTVSAADVSASAYTIGELLAPCIEADNDAREGAEAEVECEQYMTGFTDAFVQLADAAGEDVCLPEQNRPDEVRWAFTKWAMQNYDRRGEPAAEGLKIVLESAFPCP